MGNNQGQENKNVADQNYGSFVIAQGGEGIDLSDQCQINLFVKLTPQKAMVNTDCYFINNVDDDMKESFDDFRLKME